MTAVALYANEPRLLPLVLAALFAIEVIVLGWSPHDRHTWLMENLISIPVACALVVWRRRLALTPLAWLLTFLFLGLHEVGSHYTYSQVPWLEWASDHTGLSLNPERNHYDRLVHFSFGLLCIRPLTEILSRHIESQTWILRGIAVCCVVTLSSVYELLELAAALVTDPGVGIAFVGAQGDEWDAQKDMGLAFLGSLLGSAAFCRRARY